jgi:hypothetical protein
MAAQGNTDTDLGMKAILKEIEKLKSMCVKVGITEDVGDTKSEGSDATLAQIGYWNEVGVMGPPFSQYGGSKWFIPPRPFIRGWADGKRELTVKTLEKIGGLVTGGKIKAEEAIRWIGEYGAKGIKSYIKNGTFTSNADSTIARKRGSTKPLINEKTLVNSGIRYQPIEKPVEQVSEK